MTGSRGPRVLLARKKKKRRKTLWMILIPRQGDSETERVLKKTEKKNDLNKNTRERERELIKTGRGGW